MKNPDFGNTLYQKVYEYLVSLHGNRDIKFIQKYNCITVNLSYVYYNLAISYNETKIYFDTLPLTITTKLDHEEYRKLKTFRVFSFDTAKQYIDLKASENELIRKING